MDNRAKYGFRPYRCSFGELNPVPMRVADAYQGTLGGVNCDLNVGDPVAMVAAGTVEHAAVTGVIWGVIAEAVQYYDASNGRIVSPVPGNRIPGASTGGGLADRMSIVMVWPAMGITWEVDADDIVTATTFLTYMALQGENADISYTGVTATRKAWPRLDISDHKAATAQLRILEVSPTRENIDFSGANVKMLVEVNEVQNPPAQTTGI
jgi:hypothetical protein